jgi:hypothetical protein
VLAEREKDAAEQEAMKRYILDYEERSQEGEFQNFVSDLGKNVQVKVVESLQKPSTFTGAGRGRGGYQRGGKK